ncbi:D-alanine--D-alanine ligase [Microbacterium sp. CIAB417]|uniref:D-alanine--D-alanine ligase family protein n=1 Tax=Microbacterium sp. CIAB417 TaxID=2860287 RepID=UPI001FAD3369|nr:D-alanine--D-alanine ligase [Microbacterium sp. CIAB417]
MNHVVVIGGGQNAEHDVSLASAAAVVNALRGRGALVDTLTIGRDGVWSSESGPLGLGVADSLAAAVVLLGRADVVLPVVHGVLGEDGALAALCALAGARVAGSGVGAGAIGMDKWATKLVAEAVGIRTARGRLVAASDIGDVEFEEPVVVKPVSAGSSFGVSLVEEAGQLRRALDAAAQHDGRILVEEVVRGREIDVAVLREADGTRWAAPPLEISTDGLFDTETKYDGSARFTVPAVLDAAEHAALRRAALTMFDALGCSGVARIDFFLTPEGPVLNEVNTMPGMTAASQVPRMFAAAGVDYEELVARLVAGARVPVASPRSSAGVAG